MTEVKPTDIRTGGEFWAEKRDGRWQLQMRHRGPGSSFCVAQINHWADNPEALATRIVTACNAYEPMREALEKVMVGGNHLGLIIGVDHPPYTASHEEARTHYADAIWTYEAWCCWKTIMEARPALSTLPVIDRQTSDDVGILRALLEEELVWHEERDKSLSKQPQSNQVVWRRAEHQERIDVIRAALKGPASEAGKLSTGEVL